jgi:hypothetical protein
MRIGDRDEIARGGSQADCPCTICDEPLLSPDLTVTLVFERTIGSVLGDVYHVHTRCQVAWEFERGA